MKGWGAETGQAMMLPSDKDAREFRPVVAGGSVGSTSCGVLTWDRLMPHVSAELGWTGFWSRPMYDMNLAGWLNALQKTMQITMAVTQNRPKADILMMMMKTHWPLTSNRIGLFGLQSSHHVIALCKKCPAEFRSVQQKMALHIWGSPLLSTLLE